MRINGRSDSSYPQWDSILLLLLFSPILWINCTIIHLNTTLIITTCPTDQQVPRVLKTNRYFRHYSQINKPFMSTLRPSDHLFSPSIGFNRRFRGLYAFFPVISTNCNKLIHLLKFNYIKFQEAN